MVIETTPDDDSGTAARILDAATALVTESGIRATTMRAVADRAGVSRAWLYRHHPDKSALVGAVIMRLIESSWALAHAEISQVRGLTRRLALGVQIGRRAYDDPGTILMRLRTTEAADFAACVGVGVQGIVPDLAAFWRGYLDEAAATGEISADVDLDEASEWVARVLISLGMYPGRVVDPDDRAAVEAHFERFLMPGLQTGVAKTTTLSR
ncbi:putative transcriptional regulator, TetR family protein [Gordonia spumicola]|uniref:Putative transcriptional regulator, TetR family protein n=1 Tax=Gordonia spumicola TaxID=589161 RepID=A0A7I9VBS7_9ACTN|nr:TetR/AcrR family transcriptional regulator [Gordonia spumicola]GEE02785.1 putative transcriptional regulator, TetR family protein [Gordonia spumicola]